jgi:hypothetical protein
LRPDGKAGSVEQFLEISGSFFYDSQAVIDKKAGLEVRLVE